VFKARFFEDVTAMAKAWQETTLRKMYCVRGVAIIALALSSRRWLTHLARAFSAQDIELT
jgi:hypothetical protein